MERARSVAGLAVIVLLVSSGCLSDGGTSATCTDASPPQVTAEELTLSPGASATLEVEVSNATRIRMGLPRSSEVELNITDATTSPSISGQMDSYPPVWLWGECGDIEISVPVTAGESAQPGTYNYSVNAWFYHDNSTVRATPTFNITVAEQ